MSFKNVLQRKTKGKRSRAAGGFSEMSFEQNLKEVRGEVMWTSGGDDFR